MTQVVAINRAERLAITDDGVLVDFDQMFDCDGDETNDHELALIATAELPDGCWAVIVLAEFTENITNH